MGDAVPGERLDGGWWPRSRDLGTELADLVDRFPQEHGRIVRVICSPPDWDQPMPRRVAVATGFVKVGSFPTDDTHMILLRTSDRRMLHVLVIPPHFTEGQGAEAMLAAATRRNVHTAGSLLDTVTGELDVDPSSQWTDDGGSCWDPAQAVTPVRRTA
jgi:hypothetical protein